MTLEVSAAAQRGRCPRSCELLTLCGRRSEAIATALTGEGPGKPRAVLSSVPAHHSVIPEQSVSDVLHHTSGRCLVSRIRSCPLPRELSHQPDWKTGCWDPLLVTVVELCPAPERLAPFMTPSVSSDVLTSDVIRRDCDE